MQALVHGAMSMGMFMNCLLLVQACSPPPLTLAVLLSGLPVQAALACCGHGAFGFGPSVRDTAPVQVCALLGGSSPRMQQGIICAPLRAGAMRVGPNSRCVQEWVIVGKALMCSNHPTLTSRVRKG